MSHAKQRSVIGAYAISQAFFYAADLWVDKPPLVSVNALEYARQRWGDQADKVWTLKRAEIPRVDGCKISQSGLIYEHVTTGGMFRRFIEVMLTARCGILDPLSLTLWLQENFQTAWVTRDEDRTLTSHGYKSRRGDSLEEALAVYKECGIKITPRPEKCPAFVLVGDTDLEDEMDVDDVRVDEASEETAPQALAKARGDYSQFFNAVAEALQARKSRASLKLIHDRYYASVNGFDVPGASNTMLVLDAPKGTKVRTPVLSFESATTNPGLEPATQGWKALRDLLVGPEWQISYGRDKKVANALCRCKRSLAYAFAIADRSARDEAAEQTATQIDAQWTALHG